MAEPHSASFSIEEPSNISDVNDQIDGSGGDRSDRERQTILGDELTILVIKVRGLRQGCGELGGMLAEYGRPHFLCLTDTHLDSEADASITPTGYIVKARKDRSKHGSGVIIMAREDILCDDCPMFKYYVPKKAVAISGNNPTMLIFVYTQPFASDTTLIQQLESLYDKLMGNSNQRVVIVGDFNIHEVEWLRSTKTDATGKATHEFCETRGLIQLVTRPTWGEAILDLVISPYNGSVIHLPYCGSSDHQTLLVHLDRLLDVPTMAPKGLCTTGSKLTGSA